MSSIMFPDIHRSVLARLLDLAGPTQGISPRPLLGEACDLDPSQIAQLYAADIIELPEGGRLALSQVFKQVADVLLHPRTNLNLRIWNGDGVRGETSILFPGYIMGGGGVVLNQIAQYYRMSAFINGNDVFDLLLPTLPPPSMDNNYFEFQGHFDLASAVVVFAVIDLVRRKCRTMKTKTSKTVIFSPHLVVKYIRDEWGISGFQQFITYVAAAGMKPEPPSQTETLSTFDRLVKSGVINKIDDNQCYISSSFSPLYNSEQLFGGIQWQRVMDTDSDELECTNRIYLFGEKQISLCFSPTTNGWVYIAQTRVEDIIKFFINELTVCIPTDSTIQKNYINQGTTAKVSL